MADIWFAIAEWEALFSTKNSRYDSRIRGDRWDNWMLMKQQKAINNLNFEL